MQVEIDLQDGEIGYALELGDLAPEGEIDLPDCDCCDEKAEYEVMFRSMEVKARILYLCEEHKEEIKEDNE